MKETMTPNLLKNREWLYHQYWNLQKSLWDLHREFGFGHGQIIKALRNHWIKVRNHKEAMNTQRVHNKISKALVKARTGTHHTEEVKRKIGEGNIGKRYTEEAKRKISESNKLYWQKKRAEKITFKIAS